MAEITTDKNKAIRDFQLFFVFSGEKKTPCSENWKTGTIHSCIFRYPNIVDVFNPMFLERLTSSARHYLQDVYGDDTMFFIYHDENQSRLKRNELQD